MFAGNPFKIDKRMMVDEADIDIVGATSSTSKSGLKRTLPQTDSGIGSPAPRPPSNKRKPGPIPKDMIVRRPSYSLTNTPPNSPIPWMEDVKSQPATTAATAVIITTATLVAPVIESSSPANLTYSSNVSNSTLPCTNTQSEKLVNGLAEMPTIPVFEPIPVEHVNNHMDTPPTLTPMVINYINDATKSEVRSERADSGIRNECGRLSVNDCVIDNSVKVADSATNEEKLTNHIEEKRSVEPKPEKERQLTKKELEDIRRHNLNIRTSVYKEVRRKGKSK